MKKKIHIYDITLTNGELLKHIRSKEGSIQFRFNGIGTNLVPMEDSNGNTVVLSKYQIVKAELIKVEG